MTAQRNALKALELRVSIPRKSLDSAAHIVTVRNGMIDLDLFSAATALPRQRKHTSEDRWRWASTFYFEDNRDHIPTKAASVAYDPTAKCPNWRAFLRLILPDPEIRACLQRCLGAALHGSNDAQAALMFRGGGGNGKSTLINVISRVLGDYAVTCKIELFLKGPAVDANSASPEEAKMPGARLAIASEPGIDDTLSGKAIKAFTGGDLRSARALYKDAFSYRPGAIPVVQFNRTPRIVEEDEGLRRRLVFMPFDVELHKLPENQRKTPQVASRELSDELPGILNWLLDGYREFSKRARAGKGLPLGVDPPDVLQRMKAQIFEAADPLGSFLAQKTQADPTGSVRLSAFYDLFEEWSAEGGRAVLSARSVARLLREKGYRTEKRSGYTNIVGVKWV